MPDMPKKVTGFRVVWRLRDAVRSQLWPIPVLAIVIAVLLGYLLPLLDARVDDDLPSWLAKVVFGGDASSAGTVLDAVASSLITVTSLTFSLTVVTLQLASSQFSPRLLRTFTQDLFVQITLGLFLATFVYSLTVLRAVRSSDASIATLVPRIAITTSFALALASVVMLVLFLAHLTRQIRVETMVATVHSDASETLRAALDDRPERERTAPMPVAPDHGSYLLLTEKAGFFLRVDADRVLKAAEKAGAVVVIDVLPGHFLVEGTPVGRCWGEHGPLDQHVRRTLSDSVNRSLDAGIERTAGQDVAYGLRQLTDVANKALSPGINDPTTAVHALGHVGSLLSELARRTLGPIVLSDDDGTDRLALNRPGLDHLLEQSLGQPRHYGAGDLQVASQLFNVLEAVGWNVRDDDRACVQDQLHRLRVAVAEEPYTDDERVVFDAWNDSVLLALETPQELTVSSP